MQWLHPAPIVGQQRGHVFLEPIGQKQWCAVRREHLGHLMHNFLRHGQRVFADVEHEQQRTLGGHGRPHPRRPATPRHATLCLSGRSSQYALGPGRVPPRGHVVRPPFSPQEWADENQPHLAPTCITTDTLSMPVQNLWGIIFRLHMRE